MKRLILFLILATTFGALSQDRYSSGMEKALGLWGQGQPWEAANLLERIASAEEDKWIPAYYLAQINIVESFDEKDEAKLSAQLSKAKSYLDKADRISPNNPEILILRAQMLTAWVVFDGERYGMTYSGRIASLYNEAAKIAPDNPRVVLGKAQWDMGSARFFGKSTEPYCKDIQRAIKLFEKEPPAANFEPRGRIEYARAVLAKNCEG